MLLSISWDLIFLLSVMEHIMLLRIDVIPPQTKIIKLGRKISTQQTATVQEPSGSLEVAGGQKITLEVAGGKQIKKRNKKKPILSEQSEPCYDSL